MARRNYGYEKYQKEQRKKAKKEDKERRKLDRDQQVTDDKAAPAEPRDDTGR